MFVVTKDGKKLLVDDSSIDYENDYVSFQAPVGLYTDDTILKDVWLLELYKNTDKFGMRNRNGKEPSEFVTELRFEHEPTKEEILWAMSAYGLSRWDFAFVRKGYELEMDSD